MTRVAAARHPLERFGVLRVDHLQQSGSFLQAPTSDLSLWSVARVRPGRVALTQTCSAARHPSSPCLHKQQ